MTIKQLSTQANKMMDSINTACDNDQEVVIVGNGCNAFECHGVAKYYTDLINKFVEEAA